VSCQVGAFRAEFLVDAIAYHRRHAAIANTIHRAAVDTRDIVGAVLVEGCDGIKEFSALGHISFGSHDIIDSIVMG
jgi:hypothetical protein